METYEKEALVSVMAAVVKLATIVDELHPVKPQGRVVARSKCQDIVQDLKDAARRLENRGRLA